MKKIIPTLIISALSSCSVTDTTNAVQPSQAIAQAVTETANQPESTNPPETSGTEQDGVEVQLIQPEGNWIDWPITQGDWVYRQDERGSIALYGNADQDAILTLRCDKNQNILYLSRAGNPKTSAKMTIRTSHTLKSYTATALGDTPAYAAIAIKPDDRILDALVYTRGRFAIEVNGLLSVAIPSWAEIGHIVEDCR